jgi:penicillin-binding protein 1C
VEPCINLDSYVQLTLTRTASASPGFSDYDALAPHFARRVAGEVHPTAGARVQSTLDARLQRFARDSLARTLLELNSRAHQRNVHDGAAIVIDNRSGEILAWVGSAGGLSNAPEADAVVALRQAGSTLKPFCTLRPSTKSASRQPPCSTTPRSISPPAAACISRKTTITISRAG